MNEAEEFLARVNGTVNTLALACIAMIATHPNREQIGRLLQGLLEKTLKDGVDKDFVLGTRETVEMILNGIASAESRETMRVQPMETGPH